MSAWSHRRAQPIDPVGDDASRTVGLVGCVKSKRSEPSPAKDLYDSALSRGQRSAVEGVCDEWFILSALHGLLDPDAVIAPYEVTLNGARRQRKREWSQRVLGQMDRMLGPVDAIRFVIHAWQDYYAYGLLEGLRERGAAVDLPTQGLRLGRKLAYYTNEGSPSLTPLPSGADTPSKSDAKRATAPSGTSHGGKYAPLFSHLQARDADRWRAAFEEIEAVLGLPLPASARRHNAWWSNGGHRHADSWGDAGFRTSAVDLAGGRVTFVREGR